MQRNKVYAVTTLAKVAQEWGQSEDLLHEPTEQMDTEDGIECLRNMLGEHKRDHQ